MARAAEREGPRSRGELRAQVADDIEQLIARDTRAQGLPLRVTDSAALERIAAVIGASGNGERRASTRRSATAEEATRVLSSTASVRI